MNLMDKTTADDLSEMQTVIKKVQGVRNLNYLQKLKNKKIYNFWDSNHWH